MSELKDLRDRTAARLVAADIADTVVKSMWRPSTDDQLPLLYVSAIRLRRESEDRNANLSAPSFIERGTLAIMMRRSANDGETLEDALLADEQAIMEALLCDPDWLSGIEGVEAVQSAIVPAANHKGERLTADIQIEITARWRFDYPPSAVPLSTIRGTVPWDKNPAFNGNPAFGADNLDEE